MRRREILEVDEVDERGPREHTRRPRGAAPVAEAQDGSAAPAPEQDPWRSKRLWVDWRAAPRFPKGVDTRKMAMRLLAPPPAAAAAGLPWLDALIIVEGFNDAFAVHRAVRAPVYVLGGGYALADAMRPELRYLAQLAREGLLPRQMVVCTDPDWQGRSFRTYLEDELRAAATSKPAAAANKPAGAAAAAADKPAAAAAGADTPAAAAAAAPGSDAAAERPVVVRHAFLRVEQGTNWAASRNHDAGNVGVEHASADTIRTMLRRARPGFEPSRAEFTLDELRGVGMMGDWQDNAQAARPAMMRAQFCAALGLDNVSTGKALRNLLNRFFTREEYQQALAVAQAAQQEQK